VCLLFLIWAVCDCLYLPSFEKTPHLLSFKNRDLVIHAMFALSPSSEALCREHVRYLPEATLIVR
jgi:hypothetical protein